MNVFAPTIDHYVVEANISKRKKRWASTQLKNSLIMNRDSNSYTFLFAAVMVFVVASSLAFTATSLKEQARRKCS